MEMEWNKTVMDVVEWSEKRYHEMLFGIEWLGRAVDREQKTCPV